LADLMAPGLQAPALPVPYVTATIRPRRASGAASRPDQECLGLESNAPPTAPGDIQGAGSRQLRRALHTKTSNRPNHPHAVEQAADVVRARVALGHQAILTRVPDARQRVPALPSFW
jgi:hypothetical protein